MLSGVTQGAAHLFSCRILVFVVFQRQAKYTENRLKAIKARNEYLLALEATNASVFKYYIHDLSDLIDVSAAEGARSLPRPSPPSAQLETSAQLGWAAWGCQWADNWSLRSFSQWPPLLYRQEMWP